MNGTIATWDSNGRKRVLKSTIAIISLAGLLALMGPTAAEAGKPWMGHWRGSGKNTATGEGQFRVNFDVTRKKRVVDLEVKDVALGCYDQASTFYFADTEFSNTDRIVKYYSDNGPGFAGYWFYVDQKFPDGLGFSYTVAVHGLINKAWTRIKDTSSVDFSGSSVGTECLGDMSWQGTHAG